VWVRATRADKAPVLDRDDARQRGSRCWMQVQMEMQYRTHDTTVKLALWPGDAARANSAGQAQRQCGLAQVITVLRAGHAGIVVCVSGIK
jgi:hypothetical protein